MQIQRQPKTCLKTQNTIHFHLQLTCTKPVFKYIEIQNHLTISNCILTKSPDTKIATTAPSNTKLGVVGEEFDKVVARFGLQ